MDEKELIKKIVDNLDNQMIIFLKVLKRDGETTVVKSLHLQPGANKGYMINAVRELEKLNVIKVSHEEFNDAGLSENDRIYYSLTDLGKKVCYQGNIR